LGLDATSRRGGSRLRPWAELDPDQAAALRRLRAAFGFVEVLEVVHHQVGQEDDDDEAVED
jgi:hypothetical protein